LNDVSNAPAGMTFTPPLPQTGNPVCVTANWTPNSSQVGTFTLTFTAIDSHQRSSTCTVTTAPAVVWSHVPGPRHQAVPSVG